jgi:Zn-dependent M28 family amino/carboxypeptidase
VGYVEGIDPVLKKRVLLISGHYDHIGLAKEGINGDFINNGANDDASGTTAVAEMAKLHVSSQIREVFFCILCRGRKRIVRIEAFSEKLKQQNFNLYAQFNIEMIEANERDYLAYLTGFENRIWAKNEYTGKKERWISPKAPNICRSDNYSFYDVFKVPCQSVSTLTLRISTITIMCLMNLK